ncbi:MAG: 2-oxoacid:acceptor oxidoreductase subunit alpha [Gammaproteobacteria bacterium]
MESHTDSRANPGKAREFKEMENAIVRFAGDSGDGIQLTGSLFTHDSAIFGHDVSTLPEYPAEIRAPAGTRAGVSSFQLNFSSAEIHTPGDRPHILLALNPAALAVHLGDLIPGGTIVLDDDAFDAAALKKAGYVTTDPREDGTLAGYQVYRVPITTLTLEAVRPLGLGKKQASLCKNMFMLGLVAWIYDRPVGAVEAQIDSLLARRKDQPAMREMHQQQASANKLALRAGYNYADTVEVLISRYAVGKAKLPPGTYRRVTGNEATALGFLAASVIGQRPLLYASYPITPASDILHELSKYRHFGVRTVQAEDEIAAIGMAIGAAYGGCLGLTGTSGPGVALKSEAIGLAVMTELPVVIINVQRGGPSTGLPTKTEQSDLLQAIHGRNGECPVAVLAARSPAHCFAMAIEAVRIAVRYMTPVFLLSDGSIANGSEPWRTPGESELPQIDLPGPTQTGDFQPYARDPETLARRWVVPGTPGLEHCIGGLEKRDISGTVSHDPANHQRMVDLRTEKIQRIAKDIPELQVFGPAQGDLLVLGWGGTYGAIHHAVENTQRAGISVAAAHLDYLNPFPANLGAVLRSYRRVLIPELNAGQLRMLIRAQYLIDAVGLNKITGQPFRTSEIEQKIVSVLQGPDGDNRGRNGT